MKYIGHPLFQDKEYGGNKILKGPGTQKFKQFIRNTFEALPRQALHARTLSLDHPATGERKHFTSELPADMQHAIEKLRNWAKQFQ